MKLLALLTLSCFVLAGCSGIADGIGDAVADKATGKILDEVEASINVKDGFIDSLDQVFVTFGEVSLKNETGTWVKVANEISRVDLLKFQSAGTFAEIAKFTALNINYTAIRVPILDVEAVKDGKNVPIQLQTEVVEIDVDFGLVDGFAALIDFDLAESFDDSGNFQAAVKNVQLSTKDSDGDGQNDFVDTDDDNDGVADDKDSDIDGDGKSDAPTTRPSSFKDSGTTDNGYARAPAVKTGEKRWEAESYSDKRAKRQGASGEVSPFGLMSIVSSQEITLKSARWFTSCTGTTVSTLTLQGVDQDGFETEFTETLRHACGWYVHQLAFVMPGGGDIMVDAELDFVDGTSRAMPAAEPLSFFVEGETSTNGDRENFESQLFRGGAGRVELSDPIRPDGSVVPWNFTVGGSGSYHASIYFDIACDSTVSADVGFSFLDVPVDDNWLWIDYACGSGFREVDLSALGAVAPGDLQLFIVYDFEWGQMVMDWLKFDPQ